jgi:hypothetical protein
MTVAAFTAAWRPGTGAQHWASGLSYDQFKQEDKTYFDQNLRLKSLVVRDGVYAAIWRPGAGAQWWKPDMTYDEFKQQDKIYFDQGLRISSLEIDNGKYTAVWRPGSGAQWWRPGMTFSEFKLQDNAYFDQGLRLTAMELEGGKITAVWRAGAGEQWWHGELDLTDFKTEDLAYFKKGLRLEFLELSDNPFGLYRLPFDDDPDWKLFNGNFDDPISGHPDTGLNYGNNQKYAFDFAHDHNNNGIGEGGQNVRAARDGVVYALASGEIGNAWSTGTKEETVTRTGPYPPGYKGVGNFLVIRHSSGTFGTYWHLQKDSITVKVGDHVARGQVVAKSGNTGNSSTPHLHFDVRENWSLEYPGTMLEYPSVRITFQDQNHASWIPRVGDALKSNNS